MHCLTSNSFVWQKVNDISRVDSAQWYQKLRRPCFRVIHNCFYRGLPTFTMNWWSCIIVIVVGVASIVAAQEDDCMPDPWGRGVPTSDSCVAAPGRSSRGRRGICSGSGECICGECRCYQRPSPQEVLFLHLDLFAVINGVNMASGCI